MCDFDRDCPGAEVCYANVSWSDVSLCGCSFFYGGTGPNCEELTTHSYIVITLDALIIAMCSVLVLFALFTDVRVGFIKYKLFRNDDASLTWMAAFLSAAFFMIATIVTIISFIFPAENSFLRGTADDAEKESPLGTVERVFLNLSVFFAIGAALNISLMWIDVAGRTKKMLKAENTFRKYRNGVRVLQLMWLLISIVTLAVPGLTFINLLASALLVLLIGVTYFIGRRQFVELLKQSMGSGDAVTSSKKSGVGQSDRYALLVRMIKRTSSAIIIGCLVIFGLSCGIVPIAVDWKSYGSLGGIGAYATLLHGLYLSLMTLVSSIYIYTHNMLNTRIDSAKYATQGLSPGRPSKTEPSSGSKGKKLSMSESI